MAAEDRGNDMGRNAPAAPLARLPRSRTLLLAAALFAVVFGAKLDLIGRFGSDLPNWDQWDAEGLFTLLPYFRGELGVVELARPHNEHRLACSRVLSLALVELNGQWDTRLGCVVNAAIHAATVALAFAWALPLLAGGWHRGIWLIWLAVLTALPFAWHNLLSSFHSSQYLLLLLALLAAGGMVGRTPRSPQWWWGTIALVLGVFTMGSGVLAPLAVAGAVLIDRNPFAAVRSRWPTLAACAAVFGLGALLRVTVPYHETLRAHSMSEFFLAFWRCLQWPAFDFVLFPALAWLPFAWIVGRLVSGAEARRERVLVGAGLWALLQAAAMAYSRGAGAPWPASRYIDIVQVGLAVNGLALLMILARARLGSWRTWAVAAGTATAVVPCVAGMWRETRVAHTTVLPSHASAMREREENTRAYLLTGDRVHLDGRNIPYPGADALIARIGHPELRRLMPASVCPPVPVSGPAAPGQAFARDAIDPAVPPPPGLMVWGSFGRSGLATTGTWESEPLPAAQGGLWLIRIAGTAHTPGTAVHLVDPDGRKLADLRPVGGEDWSAVALRAPRRPAILRAVDSDSDGWIGFSAPVPMATGSFLAWRLANRGALVLWIGAIGACVVIMADLLGLWQTARADRPEGSPCADQP